MLQNHFIPQIKGLALYFLLAVPSLSGFAQVTYEQAFPNLNFQYAAEIQNANDGSDRIFVVEQSGRIKVFPNDKAVTSAQMNTFLDLSNVVSFSSGQEIGLLGLAFHPNYAQNGHFYVYHTRQSSVANISVEIVIARYTVSSNNPNIANPNSRLEIFRVDKNQNNSNHNGGKIAFGPDGYLYASIGDGGGAGDPRKNAQDLSNPFGSIVRLDIDLDGNNPIKTNLNLPHGNYEIPSDNPRVGQNGLDELYAWGVRNTWKFSFDKATNRLWAADVGQDGTEEINLITKGGNYGWNRFEGSTTYRTDVILTSTPDTKPVFSYGHNNGDKSITGGYVYRGSKNNPSINGKYIYGDYLSGRVWALNYSATTNSATSELLFRTNGQYISSFGEDEAGELYFSDYSNSAKIYKIVDGNSDPQPIAVSGVGDWGNLGTGVNGIIESVAVTPDQGVIVGGDFTVIGNENIANLALYDPITGWTSMGAAPNGKVNAVALSQNGTLYVGGSFKEIGGITANNVAQWNGSSWSSLDMGTNGPVGSLGIDGLGELYVGGAFQSAGGITVNNIARWMNNKWSDLRDSGTLQVGTNNEIRAIAFDEDNILYIGGNFDAAGGKSANRIATWNGTTWGTLGAGTSGFVEAIVVTPSSIFLGGNFSIAGTQIVNRIAQWNRSRQNWSPLGNGVSGNVQALAFDGIYLYVGGSFPTASDADSVHKIVRNVARWSSSDGWQALGNALDVGVTNQINTLSFSEDTKTLFVGGNFTQAGNVNVGNIARWGLELPCPENMIIPEYKLNGKWSSGASDLTVIEGTEVVLSMLPNGIDFTITLPNGSQVNGDRSLGLVSLETSGTYLLTTDQGCTKAFNLTVESQNGDQDSCIGVLDNEDSGILPSSGNLAAGADSVLGGSTDTNGSPCALSVINTGTGEPWARYHIPINLADNGIAAGDQISIGIDGRSTTGRARIEVNRDNVANSALTSFTFGSEWSRHEAIITVPEGSTTLDLWLFSNYNLQSVGAAIYDNLRIINVKATGGTCSNFLDNDVSGILLSSGNLAAGADSVLGGSTDTNGSPCSLSVINTGSGEPWSRYHIPINLAANGISVGDQISIGIDGKSTTGRARIEVARNNVANSALTFFTFGSAWSRHQATITVPAGTTTLDLWLFSNYGLQTAGTALYDNLSIVNISALAGKSFENEEEINHLQIYPNPGNSEVMIGLENSVAMEVVAIYDINSRLIQTIHPSSFHRGEEQFLLETLSYPIGVYFLQVTDVNGKQYQKQLLIRR